MTSSIQDQNPFANWAPIMNATRPPFGGSIAPDLEFPAQYPVVVDDGGIYGWGEPLPLPATNRKRRRAESGTQNNPILLSDAEYGFTSPTAHPQQAADAFMPYAPPLIIWDAEKCLEHTLNVFPGISRDHVLALYCREQFTGLQGFDKCNAIIDEIMNHNDYPKQKTARLHGPTRSSVDLKDPIATVLASELIGNEFLDIPSPYIQNVLHDTNTVQGAYMRLWKASKLEKLPYRKLPRSRNIKQQTNLERDQELITSILEEINAGRRERETLQLAEQQVRITAEKEAKNEQRARKDGDLVDCGCCYDEVPSNRLTMCDGDVIHFFCFSCTKRNVEHQLGQGKCRPLCMAGCGATFLESQLRLCIDEKLLANLFRLQQQEDLKNAGIEGLTECPFCDYMAECEPASVDCEFRCQHPDCSIVSCRLCKQEAHLPKDCETAAKDRELDGKINARHTVEEAMTNALVRSCNNCKTNFIKDEGCNKMTCPSCRNLQCYMCGESIKNYDHFQSSKNRKNCSLHDSQNVEVLHAEEVKRAGEIATAKVLEHRPDLNDEDLVIVVSEEVKKAEEFVKIHGRHDDWHRHFLLNGLAMAQQLFPANMLPMDMRVAAEPPRGPANDFDDGYQRQENILRQAHEANRRNHLERDRRRFAGRFERPNVDAPQPALNALVDVTGTGQIGNNRNAQQPPPNVRQSSANITQPPPNAQQPPPNAQQPPPNAQQPPPNAQQPHRNVTLHGRPAEAQPTQRHAMPDFAALVQRRYPHPPVVPHRVTQVNRPHGLATYCDYFATATRPPPFNMNNPVPAVDPNSVRTPRNAFASRALGFRNPGPITTAVANYRLHHGPPQYMHPRFMTAPQNAFNPMQATQVPQELPQNWIVQNPVIVHSTPQPATGGPEQPIPLDEPTFAMEWNDSFEPVPEDLW